MRFLTRCWIFRACPTRLAVRRMRTSIMAHCFALRFSTVTAKRASGVAALLKRQHCPHARFTGARIARNSRNRHRRAAIA